MVSDFSGKLAALAEVVVRIGVNLQPGQPLLITEPYEQQGVVPAAAEFVEALTKAAHDADGGKVSVIWSEPEKLRQMAASADGAAFEKLVRSHTRTMTRQLDNGGGLLCLTGSLPNLFHGIAASTLAALHEINWRHFGPVVQRLVRGETQWCLTPAPAPAWATLACGDLPHEQQLSALWKIVFAALRVESREAPLSFWQAHLSALAAQSERLNQRRVRGVRYMGDGTDLTVALSPRHRWCTAQPLSRRGVPFVVNLPTEEIFTLPHRSSAQGTLRVSRPVNFAGEVIDGIELHFAKGRVVRAAATRNDELLQQMLDTDDGAARLGEIAVLGSAVGLPEVKWTRARDIFYHPILDENAANHVALGAAYPFCHRGWLKFSANRSLIHVDLPVAAQASFVATEPA
ncbi:MAG: aminopeptidase [Candidatus Didemnitutus sp.]|nr:aminopeptidase [Candidatus Didemnitutus sp.]